MWHRSTFISECFWAAWLVNYRSLSLQITRQSLMLGALLMKGSHINLCWQQRLIIQIFTV